MSYDFTYTWDLSSEAQVSQLVSEVIAKYSLHVKTYRMMKQILLEHNIDRRILIESFCTIAKGLEGWATSSQKKEIQNTMKKHTKVVQDTLMIEKSNQTFKIVINGPTERLSFLTDYDTLQTMIEIFLKFKIRPACSSDLR